MKDYLTVKDIQELVPGWGYKSASKYADKILEKMRNENYFIPKTKNKLVLSWMVYEDLGIKRR